MSTAEEIWQWIGGYEGLYQVSNLGRLRSFHRRANGWEISQNNKKGEYLRHGLIDRDGARKTFLMHRLVAEAFIGEIPSGWQVHHIDGNKQNNAVSNLEIISPKDHRVETKRENPQITTGMVNYNKAIKPRTILQFTLDGIFIKEYPNAKIAEEVSGVCSRNILQVASGTPYNEKGNKRKQAGGYIWHFKEGGKRINDI